MSSKKFAYGRVSMKEQSEKRQLEAFKEYGIDERDCYFDKKSGKDFDREQYQILKKILREGDLLVIHSVDRLGRSYEGIAKEWKDITKNIKADIVVLDMPILDTRQHKDLLGTFINDLILGLLSYVAQIEREKINTRVKEGLEVAKKFGTKSGKPFGRPIIKKPENFEEVIDRVKRNEITNREAMSILGLKTNTYYSMIKKYKK